MIGATNGIARSDFLRRRILMHDKYRGWDPFATYGF